MSTAVFTVNKINDEWYVPIDEVTNLIEHPKGSFDKLLNFLFHLKGAKDNEIIENEGVKFLKIDETWMLCLDDICKKTKNSKFKSYLDSVLKQEELINARN